MPTFNQVRYLAQAVYSCMEQDYPDYELVVVNDASTDSTLRLLTWLEYQYPEKIRLVSLGENKGPAGAMNAGIAASSGELVCFAASDDIQLPDKISRLVEAIGDRDFCYSGYYHADIKGRPNMEVAPLPLSPDTIKDNTAMSGGALMGRKSLFLDIPFREDLRVNEDMAMAWDLYRSGRKYAVLEAPTFCYRLTQSSMSYARKREVERVTKEISKEIDAWQS